MIRIFDVVIESEFLVSTLPVTVIGVIFRKLCWAENVDYNMSITTGRLLQVVYNKSFTTSRLLHLKNNFARIWNSDKTVFHIL